MGLALLLIIWLITFLSSYFFVAHTWWPHAISASAPYIDHQWHLTFIAMGVVFIAAQVALGFVVWRYRDHGDAVKASYSHGNNKLELTWTVLTAILFLGLNAIGSPIWAAERFHSADTSAMKVEVTGLQFAWYFRYPGPDNNFGRTRPDLEDASLGGLSALGVDSADPAAKDDVVSGVLFLPVNREVDLTLRAQDVIHSFFVPAMRFKQDAVPGLMIHMHFRPEQTGDYEIACAELCGLGHYKMHGIMRVVSEPEYDKWLAAREADKQ
jgi:cytochrome c oxidase subunit 2